MGRRERNLDTAGGRTGSTADTRTASSATTIDSRVLEMDEVFDILSHPRRRYVLFTLAEAESVPFWDLTRSLAAWEAQRSQVAAEDEATARVYASLWHLHVPTLVEADVVEFDETEKTLSWGPHAEKAIAVLEGVSARLDGPDSVRPEGD